MTSNLISMAAARESRARIEHTREMLLVARLLEAGDPVPAELASRHDLDKISEWLLEFAEDDD